MKNSIESLIDSKLISKNKKRLSVMFMQFTVSSFAASALDVIVFWGLTKLLQNEIPSCYIFVSTAIARIISCLANYLLKKRRVFETKGKVYSTLWRFISLSAIQLILSAWLVSFIHGKLEISATIIKIFVDTLLFFAGFSLQRRWVFAKQKQK